LSGLCPLTPPPHIYFIITVVPKNYII